MLNKSLFSSVIALLGCATFAHANPITFTSGTFLSDGPPPHVTLSGSDGLNSSTGTAAFSINASGQLVLTLTNTSTGVWDDAQNINGISFELNNGSFITQSSVTLNSITGSTITGMTAVAGGYKPTISSTSLPTSDWKTVADGSLLTGGNHIAFNAAATAPEAGTIAGPTNGAGIYATPTSLNGETCNGAVGNITTHCGSDNAYGHLNANELPMGDVTATFLFTVTGVSNSTNLATDTGSGCTGSAATICISNVQFGFGGSDKDDGDDVTNGIYTPGTTAPTPEPSSLILLGTGILGAAGAMRRRIALGFTRA